MSASVEPDATRASVFERITAGALQQLGYVTQDLDEAVAHFGRLLGTPEFVIWRDLVPDIQYYYGEPTESTISMALLQWGGMQMEIIEPTHGRSIYRDALDATTLRLVPHHLGFDTATVEEFREVRDDIVAAGYPVAQGGVSGGTEFAYFDTRDTLGSYLEVLCPDDSTREAFAELRAR